MDEFAMGSSNETSYYGPVNNPVEDTLSPGGSSGGSAAAVARGIVPIALGSETGGSVRQPASFCGILGLKPSYGAVSRYGLVAFVSSADQIGPFARTSDDLALIYRVIAGRDPLDSTSVEASAKEDASTRELRIGLPREYFASDLNPEVARVVRECLEFLEEQGNVKVELSLPLTEKATAVYYIISSAEASSNLARFDGVRFGLRQGDGHTLDDLYEETRGAGFGTEVKRRIIMGTHVLSAGYYDEYYSKAAKVRELIRREFESAFEKVDLIIAPTSPTPPFKLGEKVDDPMAMYLSDIYTTPANLAGIPAVSVPFGESSDGRPIGVQFIAPYLHETRLFRIASVLEGRR
jgi:aspartyl-tRNA(Asn)/glutamyl-tRNA(Gln) amidotransferase subunit A